MALSRIFRLMVATLGLASAAVAQTDEAPFDLMVQTHFAQGWDTKGLQKVRELGARQVRDGVFWRQVETEAGIYDMSSIAPYHRAAAAAGIGVLLVFDGTHPAHDQGNTPYTEAGRQAYARYVAEVTAAFPETVETIEIGNEYNTDGFLVGPVEENPGAFYGPLVRAIAQEVKARRPEVRILCTGAHSVATGYFRDVFESGALPWCDGISFHPYRDEPEHVDAEIARLRALMREYGEEKPLHVTEFGKWFDDPAEAPDFMVKMVALIGAAGVQSASWYALFDQEWWPNMGLYKSFDEEMPGAAAFRFLKNELLPLGRPVARAERGEDQVFEFGRGGRAFVLWGAPAEIIVTGEARYFDSSGRPIDPVTELSSRPVVIMGEGLEVALRREEPVYNAFLGYGGAPWSYLAVAPALGEMPFEVMDWNWNPYLGHPSLNPMKVTPVVVEGAWFDGVPYHAVERFTAPRTGSYRVSGRWFHEDDPGDSGDGADIRISLNGEVLASGLVADTPWTWETQSLSLREGDVLDFAVGPNTGPGGDYARREITVVGPKAD